MAGPQKLKLNKRPDSWNTKTLTEEESRAIAQKGAQLFAQAQSKSSGYGAPSRLERVSNTVTGGLKGSAAGFVNALGTTQAVTGGVIRKNYLTRDIEQLQNDLARYQYEADNAVDALDRDIFLRQAQKVQESLDMALRNMEQTKTAGQSYQQTADKIAAASAKDIAEAKQGLGTVGQFLVDVGSAGTQLAGDILAGAILSPVTGGASALAPMAVRSFGGGAQQARQEGASLGQQVGYGLGSAALSVGTEKISNVSKLFSKPFGEGVAEKLAGKLVSRFGDNVAIKTMNRLAQTPVGRLAASAIGEGSEEFIEDMLQPVLQRATYDPSAKFDLSEAIYDAAVGAALGGVGGGIDIALHRPSDSAGTTQAGTAPVSTTQEQRPTQSVTAQNTPVSTPDGTSALAGDLDTVVDTGDGAGTTPGTVGTVTDGRASQSKIGAKGQPSSHTRRDFCPYG